MPVIFSYADVRLSYPCKRLLQSYLLTLAQAEGRSVDVLTYVFCSDDYLLGINQQFLQHDDYTDIITFDLSSKGQEGITGEIYISVERVKENAAMLNVPFRSELERVVFHGLLHLCGYTDKQAKQQQLMRKAEDHHLLQFAQVKQHCGCST